MLSQQKTAVAQLQDKIDQMTNQLAQNYQKGQNLQNQLTAKDKSLVQVQSQIKNLQS